MHLSKKTDGIQFRGAIGEGRNEGKGTNPDCFQRGKMSKVRAFGKEEEKGPQEEWHSQRGLGLLKGTEVG